MLNLKFSNLFAFGDNNEIDFQNRKGVLSINGKNKYGKSSIIDIILFSLYGKCTKGLTQKDYLNYRKKNLICILELMVNGNKFRIIRYAATGKKDVKNLKIGLEFYQFENNQYKCITGTDSSHTQKKIESFIGTYDDLILTNVLLQNEVSFISLSNSERIDHLMKLYNIEIFDNLYNVANDEYKSKKTLYKHLQNELMQYDSILLQDKLKKFNEDIKIKMDKTSNLQSEQKEYELHIYELYRKMESVETKNITKKKL